MIIRKKKILVFSSYYLPYLSGMTVYLSRVIRSLATKYEVVLLTFQKNIDKSNLSNLSTSIPYQIKISKGFLSITSIFYFIRYLDNSRVLILNLPSLESIFLAFYARFMKIPIISVFHCQISYTSNFLENILIFIVNYATLIQLKLSNKIIVTSKSYLSRIWYPNQLLSRTIEVIPATGNATVDLKLLHILKENKKNQIWLGFFGRISREKRLEWLLDWLLINKDYNLIIAGPKFGLVAGENKYLQKIKPKLDQLGDRIVYYFNLNDRELNALMRVVDVLVISSNLATEAFGLVQIEAMIQGCRVLAPNLEGVNVPVSLTGMGILYLHNSFEDFSKKLHNLINQNIGIEELRIKRKLALQIFSLSRFKNEYLRIIDGVLSENSY